MTVKASSNLPAGAQLRAARARVIGDFAGARLNSFASENLHAPCRPAPTHRLLRGTLATARLKPQSLFDDPIFERVKRDDHQPPALFERVNRVGDESIQSFKLPVDRYAQRLEGLRRRMDAPVAFWMNRLDNQIGELLGRGDGRRLPLPDNPTSDASRGPLFAVFKDDVGQLTLAEIVDQISRCQFLRTVHPHIQRGCAQRARVQGTRARWILGPRILGWTAL